MSVTTTAIHAVDPLVVEDLRLVERTAAHFGSPGMRPEFWELFTLLKSNRDAFVAEALRLEAARKAGEAAAVDPGLLEKLRQIRKDYFPLARELRVFLQKTEVPLDGMRLELGLVLTMASTRGREAALRWVADPVHQAPEAMPRIRVMTRLVDQYRKALLEQMMAAPPPPADDPLPAPVPAPAAKPEDKPLRIHPQFLGDLRAGRRFVELLSIGRQPVELWEAVGFILVDRASAAAALRELQRLKRAGKPGEFAGETFRTRERLKELRGKLGRFVGDLRAFFIRTFGTWEGEIEELVLAFIAASARGRHRARQWLDDPELCKDEAARFVADLRSRAGEYREALKDPAADEAATPPA
jgi:hypothetical protein